MDLKTVADTHPLHSIGARTAVQIEFAHQRFVVASFFVTSLVIASLVLPVDCV